MVNYSNGKIYKIEPICEHEENEIYIGSTTKQYLSQRMDAHRNHYKNAKLSRKCTSIILFDKYGVENCSIVLLENVNANTRDELLARENHYIRTLKCVNKVRPVINKEEKKEYHKEYYENNKESLNEAKKLYNENNKESINEAKKLYNENNKEAIKEYKKRFYQENKEKNKDKDKKYREDNKEKLKAYFKKRYEEKKKNKDNII
jgi:hypothetical protein